jgi:hypothetical protein
VVFHSSVSCAADDGSDEGEGSGWLRWEVDPKARACWSLSNSLSVLLTLVLFGLVLGFPCLVLSILVLSILVLSMLVSADHFHLT